MNHVPAVWRLPAMSARLQSGLSLIELMISLLISTLILAGLTQVFTVNRSTHQTDEGMARLQENARFALDFLSRDLRTAGSFGCMSPNALKKEQPFPQNSKISSFPVNALNVGALFSPISGHDATAIAPGTTAYTLPTLYPPTLTPATNPAMDVTLAPAGGVVPGSDALVTRTMDPEVYNLAADLPLSGNAISVSGSANLANGQLILVTNCTTRAMINTVMGSSTSGAVTTINVNPYTGVDNIDQYTGQIATLRTMLYYVGIGSNNGPALFSRNFSDGVGTPQELVEGVENLQLSYGVNGPLGFSYKTASEVTAAAEWPTVTSIRIAMLVATGNIITSNDYSAGSNRGGTETALDTNIYTMQGIALTPNADHRRRRVFETSVRIRNLGIGVKNPGVD